MSWILIEGNVLKEIRQIRQFRWSSMGGCSLKGTPSNPSNASIPLEFDGEVQFIGTPSNPSNPSIPLEFDGEVQF